VATAVIRGKVAANTLYRFFIPGRVGGDGVVFGGNPPGSESGAVVYRRFGSMGDVSGLFSYGVSQIA